MAKHKQLLLALFCGVALGLLANLNAGAPWLNALTAYVMQPMGQIFLRLIFMAVVPLVFSALVLGVCELGQGHGLGRVAARTLGYTVLVSAFSVLIGVTLVNVFRPGTGLDLGGIRGETVARNAAAVATISGQAAQAKPVQQTLIELIPKNPLDAAVRALDGEMLALMVFALIFGAALSLLTRAGEEKNPLVAVIEQLFAVCMKIIGFAMAIAPLGVFALVFTTVSQSGFAILKSLLFYVVIVVAGLLLQQFVVYGAFLKFVARRSPAEFFKNIQDVCLYAFSTASSNATLPEALDAAENNLRLPPRISRFVLTVGATANQNGTALFEGITVLFLAQVYGVDLDLAAQVKVVLMSILAGIGTAGVPGGSLPLIMILLQSVGIPPEGIGLILGVDRFLDMCRTTVNVSGDLVIATLVSRGEEGAKT